jgi:hypothetical protein
MNDRQILSTGPTEARPQQGGILEKRKKKEKRKKRKHSLLAKEDENVLAGEKLIPASNQTLDNPHLAKRRRSHPRAVGHFKSSSSSSLSCEGEITEPKTTRTATSINCEHTCPDTADTAESSVNTNEMDDSDDSNGDDGLEDDGAAAGSRGPGNRKKRGKWRPLEDARLRAWQRENKLPKWMAKQFHGVRTECAIIQRLRKLEQIDTQEDQMWFGVVQVLERKTEGDVKKYLVRWEDSWVEEEGIDPGLIRVFEGERESEGTSSIRAR